MSDSSLDDRRISEVRSPSTRMFPGCSCDIRTWLTIGCDIRTLFRERIRGASPHREISVSSIRRVSNARLQKPRNRVP
jgi:hypothetical protein